MPKRTKVAGTATPGQVQAALKTYKKPHEQKRLLALKMAQQGQFTRAQIGDALNKSRATIGRWLKAYLSGGIQALLKRGHGGKQPTLQPDDIDALKDGLRSGQFKTAKQIANWLEKERGILLVGQSQSQAQRASKSTCQARPQSERGLQTKHCRPARRLGDSKRLSDTHLG